MALIFLDGMDKLGPANTNSAAITSAIVLGEWTTTSGTFAVVAPLSATGQALKLSGTNPLLTKTLTANYARLIGGVRFSSTQVSQTYLIAFRDGATAQCTITLETTGVIQLRNGSNSGTVITSGGSISASSTHYLEWDITFGNTAAYQVWLDGVSLFSGTGDTTATANNYANAIVIGAASGGSGVTWDDLYLFDNTGSTNNAVLLTSPRIETQFPTGDALAQFAPGPAVVGSAMARNASNSSPISSAANEFRVKQVTPGVNCTLQSVAIYSGTATLATNTLRPVIYADSAGAPGSLLGSGTTAAGASAGNVATLTLTTGIALTAGTPYWIGVMISASGTNNIWSQDATQDRTGTSTFASGAPGTAPSTTLQAAGAYMWGNVTVAAGAGNWWCTSPSPPTTASYVFESVVGEEDLYTYPALSVPPSAIYAVAVKAIIAKSDAGTKTVSMRMKSGSTDSAGSTSSAAPTTSYGWLTSNFPLDPNGSAAWTFSALNAAQAGVKVET